MSELIWSARYLRSSYAVVISIIVVLTITSRVMHGYLIGWSHSRPDERILEKKLEEFPGDFGSWEVQQALSLTPYVQNVLECRSYLHRHYVHRESGKAVTVAVVVGPAGPISVHTPEICYSTRDYKLHEDRLRTTIRLEPAPARLWKTTLYPTGTDQGPLRVY